MKSKRNDNITTEVHLKVIIVGDMATGKTSIIKRYLYDKFDSNNNPTIVPELKTKIIKINGINYNINFWDIPAQDRNAFILGAFVRDSNGIIYCCDVGNKKSMENLKKWEESLKSKENIEDIPKIIIENNCELLGDENHYNDNIAYLRKMCIELGCLNFFRVSSSNGYNIENSINYLVYEIIKRIKAELDKEDFINNRVKLKNKKNKLESNKKYDENNNTKNKKNNLENNKKYDENDNNMIFKNLSKYLNY